MAETIKKSTIKVLDETSSSGYVVVYPKTSQDQVEGSLITYKSFEDLNLAEATATAIDITNAMIDGSFFVTLLGSDTSISLAPPQVNCLLKVTKTGTNAEFSLTNLSNTTGWCGYCDGTTWNGWNGRGRIIISREEPVSGVAVGDLWYQVIHVPDEG